MKNAKRIHFVFINKTTLKLASLFACWVIFHALLLPLLTFKTKIFQEHYQSVKRFGPRSGLIVADNKVVASKERVKQSHLFWNLTEVVDKANGGIFLEWVVYSVDINVTLIEEMVEHIDSINSCLALLLASKDQINPFMKVSTYIVTFQGLKQIPYWI